jgi:hypothetical protein
MAKGDSSSKKESKESLDTILRVTFTVEVEFKGLKNKPGSNVALSELLSSYSCGGSEDDLSMAFERYREETDFNWEPQFSVSTNIQSDQFDKKSSLSRYWKRAFDHLTNNFPTEVKETAIQMMLFEPVVNESYKVGADAGSRVRSQALQHFRKSAEARIDQRLRKNKGRPREIDKQTYPYNREQYFFRCVDALSKLDAKKERLTFGNLAQELYPDTSSDQKVEDPGKALRNKLKTYNLTWELIKDYHSGKNRSLLSFHEDEMAVIDRMMD